MASSLTATTIFVAGRLAPLGGDARSGPSGLLRSTEYASYGAPMNESWSVKSRWASSGVANDLSGIHEVGDRIGPRLGDRVDTVVGATVAIAQVDGVVHHRLRDLETERRVHVEIVREELFTREPLLAGEEEHNLSMATC